VLFIYFYLFIFFFFYRIISFFFSSILYYIFFFFISFVSFWDFNLYLHTANNVLWDGLAVVHPPITIVAYSNVFFCFFLSYSNFFKLKNFYLFKASLYKYAASTLMLALLLGSWWAQQELNWGGWWGWDPVEIGLFILYLTALGSVHCSFIKKKLAVAIILFIFHFLNIKLNYLASIHNFIVGVYVVPTPYFILFILFIYSFNTQRYLSSLFFILYMFIVVYFINMLSLAISVFLFVNFLIIYTLFTQRFIFFINPMPIFFSFFSFFKIKKMRFMHYGIHIFIFIIIFFKLTFFFTNLENLKGDFSVFFNEAYFYKTYIIFNKFYTQTIFFISILINDSISIINSLVNLRDNFLGQLPILSQVLYIYNWCFALLVWNLFLISSVLSFNAAVFLIKKQSV